MFLWWLNILHAFSPGPEQTIHTRGTVCYHRFNTLHSAHVTRYFEEKRINSNSPPKVLAFKSPRLSHVTNQSAPMERVQGQCSCCSCQSDWWYSTRLSDNVLRQVLRCSLPHVSVCQDPMAGIRTASMHRQTVPHSCSTCCRPLDRRTRSEQDSPIPAKRCLDESRQCCPSKPFVDLETSSACLVARALILSHKMHSDRRLSQITIAEVMQCCVVIAIAGCTGFDFELSISTFL